MRSGKVITLRRRKCKRRVRAVAVGTAQRPRLSVFRSNCHIYAQLIDDAAGNTIAAASTRQKAVASELSGKLGSNQQAAQLIGKTIAAQALAKGISSVCFDRGRYRYHGRVKALADAAREAGLKF